MAGGHHQAEDDLTDLMEVFDFFDVFDGEAADLESHITASSHGQQHVGVRSNHNLHHQRVAAAAAASGLSNGSSNNSNSGGSNNNASSSSLIGHNAVASAAAASRQRLNASGSPLAPNSRGLPTMPTGNSNSSNNNNNIGGDVHMGQVESIFRNIAPILKLDPSNNTSIAMLGGGGGKWVTPIASPTFGSSYFVAAGSPPVVGSYETAGEHVPYPSPASAAASSPSESPSAGKQRRGRKKKEESNGEGASKEPSGKVKSSSSSAPSEEEKERLRRESNKQSARNSRKKKKEYVIVLSEAISSLTKEVQQLRTDVARKSAEDEHKEKLSCIGRNAFLQALEVHGPNSTKRKITTMYQFENLTRNVAPPHTRFLLWAISRKATEPDSAAARTWQEVTQVMGLQPEQHERLAVLFRSKKATDPASVEERDKLQFIFGAMLKLRNSMDQMASKLSAHHAALLDILSPVQQALLFQYIEESRCANNANETVRGFSLANNIDPTPEGQRARQVLSQPPPNPNRIVSRTDEANLIDLLLTLK